MRNEKPKRNRFRLFIFVYRGETKTEKKIIRLITLFRLCDIINTTTQMKMTMTSSSSSSKLIIHLYLGRTEYIRMFSTCHVRFFFSLSHTHLTLCFPVNSFEKQNIETRLPKYINLMYNHRRPCQ